MKTTADIRGLFVDKYDNQDFVTDRTGVKTIEVIGESFLVDDDWIIRKPNYDYVRRELEWYHSKSLYVNDIPGEVPKIWKQVADRDGKINSNYGYLIWSDENFNQYKNVLRELERNPNSRRAAMIYNRPSMHYDYDANGMNDFVCTFANTFFIRDGKLVSHYMMRSNCAVHGFCNDAQWALHVQSLLAKDLNVEIGDLIWTASSLHVYEYHFIHIENLKRSESQLLLV